MRRKSCQILASVLVVLIATVAFGARIRPGGDPRTDRVIWADPFDNYSQWAWDNRSNPVYQPNGTLWDGGPMPAGSSTGIYPYKSDNGDPANPYNGCGVTLQTSPSRLYLAWQAWVTNDCGSFKTPAGFTVGPSTFYAGPDSFTAGTNCTKGGWVETIAEFGRVDCVWQQESGYYTSLGIFTHDLVPRIQSWSPLRAWDQPNPNAVQGTDEHPLTLVFNLHDSGNPANARSFINNTYVELNLDDEHAPTDYIWRGKRDKDYESRDPECCPEGPYPIICQQVREVNEGNYEQQGDLDYLNAHCPSLVPPFDPQTGTGKTWPAIAFGFLAVADKDPCKCMEQGLAAHLPQMNHPMFFDGNVWRELRAGRGNELTECPPSWVYSPPEVEGYEASMQDSGGGSCGDFTLGGGSHRVYLKLTTNKVLIWMSTQRRSGGVTVYYDYCGAFDRVYKGPFNRVAVGVGPGCELQDKAAEGDSYTCKVGGTPTRCLTYSSSKTISGVPTDGYWRTNLDAMVLLDGVLVENANAGACCKPDGECVIATQGECTLLDGIYYGANTLCENYQCCPRPFADADADGDVDQDDFGTFQTCYTGAPTSGVPAGCECLNHNGDQGIDGSDFAEFDKCYTGANVPWSQALAPQCDP